MAYFTLEKSHLHSYYIYYIGGSPQVPVVQVGQLIPEGSDALELGLKNEENSRFGFCALHLGQSNLEPSSPID
jgi:hypothetical protein